MTVKEAMAKGYHVTDIKYFVGYVSRKIDVSNQEVLTAKGKRNGHLYYEAPNWNSSRFAFRVYIAK